MMFAIILRRHSGKWMLRTRWSIWLLMPNWGVFGLCKLSCCCVMRTACCQKDIIIFVLCTFLAEHYSVKLRVKKLWGLYCWNNSVYFGWLLKHMEIAVHSCVLSFWSVCWHFNNPVLLEHQVSLAFVISGLIFGAYWKVWKCIVDTFIDMPVFLHQVFDGL